MLLANNRYTLSFAANGQAAVVELLARFDPAYTSPRRIRSRYPALVSGATDMELWEAIYDSSLQADFLTRDRVSVDPFVRERFVSCSAALSWIRQAMMKDAWDQSARRTLGDLTVDDKLSSPQNLLGLIEDLKAEYEQWYKALLGKKKPTSAYTAWQQGMSLEGRLWD